jgi:uncharacterized protein
MLITVRVIPRSSRNALAWEQGTLKARLTAPPVDGAANAALINLLAERLSVPRRNISIVRGETARQKMLEIADLTPDEVERRLSTGDA